MQKLIASLPLVFLLGCTTTPTTENQPIQSKALSAQRDLLDPSISQRGGGFMTVEAKQLLEFCIELNSQDERNKDTNKQNPSYARPGNWQLVYDSRNPGNTIWNNPAKISANDPKVNGIKPFNNAWLLSKNSDNPKQYAIAIRGTVGEKSSILDDALVTTIPANSGIVYPRNRHLPIVFAVTPHAELHLGFANAAFALLFDKDRGILAALKKANLPADAQLLITGHSQGAAVATIVHAFLYYALTDPADRYKLGLHLQNKDVAGVLLKSYVFAQPKPGNLQFAEDFARISKDLSYVVNNDLDPVPQVPLTIQSPSEVLRSIAADNSGTGKLVEDIVFWKKNIKIAAIDDFKDHFAKTGAEKVAKLYEIKNVNLDILYFDSATTPEPAKASSLNYTMAGQLIPLFGAVKGGGFYPLKGRVDVLLQHHATSYRSLMERQLQ
jgi:hypothetical protein